MLFGWPLVTSSPASTNTRCPRHAPRFVPSQRVLLWLTALPVLSLLFAPAPRCSAVPTIATAWQGVAESESRRAGDAACAAYAAAFSEDVPSEEAALVAEHQHALLAAKQAFDEIAIGDEGVRRANEQRWRDSCEARFQQLQDRKLAQAAAACEKLLNDATMQLAAMARGDGVTVEQLQQAAAAFKAEYAASPAASGPTKWPRFTGAVCAVQLTHSLCCCPVAHGNRHVCLFVRRQTCVVSTCRVCCVCSVTLHLQLRGLHPESA